MCLYITGTILNKSLNRTRLDRLHVCTCRILMTLVYSVLQLILQLIVSKYFPVFILYFQKVLLDVVPGIDDHPAKINGDSPLHHILNDADILGQVCRYGAVSQSDTVAQLSRQLLNRLISQSLVQTDETSCSDLRELLRQWIPYIEVPYMHAHSHMCILVLS